MVSCHWFLKTTLLYRVWWNVAAPCWASQRLTNSKWKYAVWHRLYCTVDEKRLLHSQALVNEQLCRSHKFLTETHDITSQTRVPPYHSADAAKSGSAAYAVPLVWGWFTRWSRGGSFSTSSAESTWPPHAKNLQRAHGDTELTIRLGTSTGRSAQKSVLW